MLRKISSGFHIVKTIKLTVRQSKTRVLPEPGPAGKNNGSRCVDRLSLAVGGNKFDFLPKRFKRIITSYFLINFIVSDCQKKECSTSCDAAFNSPAFKIRYQQKNFSKNYISIKAANEREELETFTLPFFPLYFPIIQITLLNPFSRQIPERYFLYTIQ